MHSAGHLTEHGARDCWKNADNQYGTVKQAMGTGELRKRTWSPVRTKNEPAQPAGLMVRNTGAHRTLPGCNSRGDASFQNGYRWARVRKPNSAENSL